jgi:hypothetical protein
MAEKKFKPNHGASTVFEALGIDEAKYDKLMSDAIDKYNKDNVSLSSSLTEAVKSVREEILGVEKDDEPSQYELLLANTLFEMGKKQIKSQIDRLLDSTKKSGMPIVLAGPAIIGGLIDIFTDGNGSGHKCTKCGKCGKKFDDKGNEIEG